MRLLSGNPGMYQHSIQQSTEGESTQQEPEHGEDTIARVKGKKNLARLFKNNTESSVLVQRFKFFQVCELAFKSTATPCCASNHVSNVNKLLFWSYEHFFNAILNYLTVYYYPSVLLCLQKTPSSAYGCDWTVIAVLCDSTTLIEVKRSVMVLH